MVPEHSRRAHCKPTVGRRCRGLNELTLDLLELHRRNTTETNPDRKSAIPLLGGMRHGPACHPVISERLQLRGMSRRAKRSVSHDSDDVEDATAKDEAGNELGNLYQYHDVRIREVRRNRTPPIAERRERTVGIGPVVTVRHEPGNGRKQTRDVTNILVDVDIICDCPERTAHKERPSLILSDRGLQARVARSSLPTGVGCRGHESRVLVTSDINPATCDRSTTMCRPRADHRIRAPGSRIGRVFTHAFGFSPRPRAGDGHVAVNNDHCDQGGGLRAVETVQRGHEGEHIVLRCPDC